MTICCWDISNWAIPPANSDKHGGTLQLDLSLPRLLGRFHKLKNYTWVWWGSSTLKGGAMFSGLPDGWSSLHTLQWYLWILWKSILFLTCMRKFNYITTYIRIYIYTYIYIYIYILVYYIIHIHILFMYRLQLTGGGWLASLVPISSDQFTILI